MGHSFLGSFMRFGRGVAVAGPEGSGVAKTTKTCRGGIDRYTRRPLKCRGVEGVPGPEPRLRIPRGDPL